MEHTPCFPLEVVAERAYVGEIVKAIISTVFFHRIFPPVRPKCSDVLDMTLPSIDDAAIEDLINTRVKTLLKGIDTGEFSAQGKSRGRISVQFFEKKRKKSAWFAVRADEEVCWEEWVLNITLLTPRTDSERLKARHSMETHLQKAILQIITTVSFQKDHIPPITENNNNPFPFQIVVGGKSETWRMGIF